MVANLRIWNNLDISLIQIDLAKSLLSVLVPPRTCSYLYKFLQYSSPYLPLVKYALYRPLICIRNTNKKSKVHVTKAYYGNIFTNL